MRSAARPLLLALALAPFAADAAAQTPLTTVRVASGLTGPLWVGSPPNDPRLFIIEKAGRIKILLNGAVLPTVFLDVTALNTNGSEQGLLGMAFHPQFATNGFFYINYTNNAGDTVVARYTVDTTNPNVADPTTARQIILIDQNQTNHNAGDLAFGPMDGYLYIPMGDGGGGNDAGCRAQTTSTMTSQVFLGKMLRIDVDGGTPYGIPADNPFTADPTVPDEIFHLGLRNPFRFSFDRATGDMYIGDVGQDTQEEVDVLFHGEAGLNLGWPIMEGNSCNALAPGTCPAGTPACFSASFEAPVFTRTHTGFQGPCSVIGGVVYRGCAIPDLQGTYFTADHCDDVIHSFRYDTTGLTDLTNRTAELDPPGAFSITSIADFGEDAFGEIYIPDLNGGEVFKIVAASTPTGFSDCNGDGQDDACQIAKNPDLDLDLDGTLDLCQSLSADTGGVSQAANGTQSMSLHAPVGQANLVYVLLGAFNNTPGVMYQGFHVPLNPDAFFLFSVTHPNIPPYVGNVGMLDTDATASAAFDLTSFTLPPTAIGRTVYHAYGTLNGGTLNFVSNFITTRFDP